MKVMFVVHGFPPECRGGTEATVEVLARAMQRAGHQVLVVAGSLVGGAPEQVGHGEWDGLPVLRLHRDDLYYENWWKSHSPAVSFEFTALLERERPDVVHVHHWLRLTSDLVRLARRSGAVTAVTLHDHFAVLARPVRWIGEELALPPAADGLVGKAEAAEAFLFHRRDLAAEVCAAHLCYVPSAAHEASLRSMGPPELAGVSMQVLRPPAVQVMPVVSRGQGASASSAGPASARGRRLLFFGTLYDAKGLDLVLQALPALGSDAGGFSLTVLGAAHDEGYLRQLQWAAEGLPVTFCGAYDQAMLQQVDADYAVLPARTHESHGLTFDEACSLGLPILAADIPAYVERAEPGTVAFFRASDARSLAALLQDTERLLRLRNPRPPAVADADGVAERLLSDYRSVQEVPIGDWPDLEQERIRLLFRRAERRYWSALQGSERMAPPDAFLGGQSGVEPGPSPGAGD